MELICIDGNAFQELFGELIEKIKLEHAIQADPWVSTDEAMRLLRITSKTTLKKFCDEGRIVCSPLTNKLILYRRDSTRWRQVLPSPRQNRAARQGF